MTDSLRDGGELVSHLQRLNQQANGAIRVKIVCLVSIYYE